MLNNNDLRPAYAFAYVTEPQETKKEEEVNLSPTVFKWFWVAVAAVSTAFSYNQAQNAANKAKKAKEKAVKAAKQAQQKLIDTKKESQKQITAQEKKFDQQKAYQTQVQKETDEALAQSKADTLAAQKIATEDIGYAKQQSQLQLAANKAQLEQQLALTEGAEEEGPSVGQPGVSYTPVKKASSLGIGGTQSPEEGSQPTSGLTI